MPASHRAHLEWTPAKLIDWGGRVGVSGAAVVRNEGPGTLTLTAAVSCGLQVAAGQAGILDGAAATPEQVAIAEKISLPLAYPKFLGNPVNDLVEFFWIFVMLAGVAGGILFLLSFPLRKKMHGAD